MRRRVSLTVAMALWAFTAAAQPPQEAAQLAREGRTLAPAEVQVLENALKTTPDDLSARTRLVGYYFSSGLAALGADATRAARRRHILWIIEHHPEAEVTMLSEMTIDPAGHPLADADAYAEGKKLWLAQVAAHKDDPRMLIHAARFFRLPERVLALDLLKQAIRLSPGDVAAAELGYTYAITILGITMINNNGLPMNADPVAATAPLARQSVEELRSSTNLTMVRVAAGILSQYGVMVSLASRGAINEDALAEELLKKVEAEDTTDFLTPQSLASFYHLRWVRGATQEEKAGFARQELQHAELALSRSGGNEDWHRSLLITAAKAAIEANEVATARQRAAQALADVGSRNDRTTGQIIHDSHIVLGRVALRSGQVDEAKAHLIQAGKVTGGGTLTSFGPNMSLAKELFERGERDAVLQYLEECNMFWSFNGTARRWIDTIKAGGTPNFAPNLID